MEFLPNQGEMANMMAASLFVPSTLEELHKFVRTGFHAQAHTLHGPEGVCHNLNKVWETFKALDERLLRIESEVRKLSQYAQSLDLTGAQRKKDTQNEPVNDNDVFMSSATVVRGTTGPAENEEGMQYVDLSHYGTINNQTSPVASTSTKPPVPSQPPSIPSSSKTAHRDHLTTAPFIPTGSSSLSPRSRRTVPSRPSLFSIPNRRPPQLTNEPVIHVEARRIGLPGPSYLSPSSSQSRSKTGNKKVQKGNGRKTSHKMVKDRLLGVKNRMRVDSPSTTESNGDTEGEDQLGTELIACDKCSSWFHVECSGLKKDDPCLTNENIDFVCMSCVRRAGTRNLFPVDKSKCGNPECTRALEQEGEYVIEQIIGRRATKPGTKTDDKDAVEYLVKWDGHGIKDATWMPRSNIGKLFPVFLARFELVASAEAARRIETPPRPGPAILPKTVLLQEAKDAGWGKD